MASIGDIRQQYPQYHDMSDIQLADALHTKYYSDIPKDKFFDSVGLTNPSFLPRVGADLLAGLSQAGHGLLNTPHNLVNAISPELASHIPSQQNYDFGKELGVNNPNFGDKLVQGIGQYAPYLAGGEAAGLSGLAGDAGLGALFGATQSENPATGALESAAANTGIGLIGKGLGAAKEAGKDYLSQFAAKGFGDKVKKGLEGVKDVSNKEAFSLAKQNFDKFSDKERSAWDALSTIAKDADTSKSSFDNEGYNKSLKDQLEELTKQSSDQSAFGRFNKESIDLLKGYAKDQHGSFADAIEHNKSLNKDFQNEIAPGQPLPFRTVNYAKSAIKDAINKNIDDNGLGDTLGKAWSDANSITADKNKIFNELSNAAGKQQYSKFSGIVSGKGEFTDPTTFVADYVPTSRGDGSEKMQQFAKMIGNEGKAKDILKMNYFDKSFENNEVNPKSFVNKYNNLSPDQQHYLFEPAQNKNIQALSKLLSSHPNALAGNGQLSGLQHSLLSAMGIGAGYSAGHLLGAPVEGALLGSVIPGLASSGLSAALSTPTMAKYFSDYLTQGAANKAANKGLVDKLIASLVLPHIGS